MFSVYILRHLSSFNVSSVQRLIDEQECAFLTCSYLTSTASTASSASKASTTSTAPPVSSTLTPTTSKCTANAGSSQCKFPFKYKVENKTFLTLSVFENQHPHKTN